MEEKDLEKEEQAALEKNSDEVKKKQSRTVEETLPSGEKLTDAINRNNVKKQRSLMHSSLRCFRSLLNWVVFDFFCLWIFFDIVFA
ncbi:hypothetical protein C1H46_041545 [Malus baccata]|uniref:Uncharacterized protein n=1 Tax=Malus baccata TaxID=106549 RepID=A0A540KFC3_MALBA|nr:hypothetical protein C1H46_041545 [Malus baccata]